MRQKLLLLAMTKDGNAVEIVQAFYDEHGHHFANFSLDNAEQVS